MVRFECESLFIAVSPPGQPAGSRDRETAVKRLYLNVCAVVTYLRTLTSSEATDVAILMKENQMVTDCPRAEFLALVALGST